MRVIEIATPDGVGWYFPIERVPGISDAPGVPHFPDAAAVRLVNVDPEDYINLPEALKRPPQP
jgi:hypothetical protein